MPHGHVPVKVFCGYSQLGSGPETDPDHDHISSGQGTPQDPPGGVGQCGGMESFSAWPPEPHVSVPTKHHG